MSLCQWLLTLLHWESPISHYHDVQVDTVLKIKCVLYGFKIDMYVDYEYIVRWLYSHEACVNCMCCINSMAGRKDALVHGKTMFDKEK